MGKTTSGSILGVIQKESWILDHFKIFVNIAWRRFALSECFSSIDHVNCHSTRVHVEHVRFLVL